MPDGTEPQADSPLAVAATAALDAYKRYVTDRCRANLGRLHDAMRALDAAVQEAS